MFILYRCYIIVSPVSDVDECKNSPCQHGGTCVNEHGGHRCTCPSGFDGNNCENGRAELFRYL